MKPNDADAATPGSVTAVRGLRWSTQHLALPLYVLLAAVATSSWYAGADLVWGDDATHPVSLVRISTYFRLVDPTLGGPDGRKFPFILPLGAILEAWRRLHLPYSLHVIQPVVVVLLLAAGAYGMYLLIRTLLPSVSPPAAFGGGLFYAFNIYATVTIWSAMAYLTIQYALLPAVVLVWLWAFRRGTAAAAIVAGMAWAVALTPAYITTPVAMTDSMLFVAVGLTAVAISRGRRLRTFATGAGIYCVWLALSLFWLIPLLSTTSAVSQAGKIAGDSASLFAANSSPLADALRLGGYWGATATYLGAPYYAWSSYYKHVGLPASTAVPAFALLGVWAWRATRLPKPPLSLGVGERLAIAFATGLAVVALLLITGAHTPLGGLKVYAVSHLGLGGPFRSVYQRFGVYLALAYGPLVAVGIACAQALVGRRASGRTVGLLVAGVATAAVAVVPAWPMWSGSIMDSSGLAPARRITIPSDYPRVASLIDNTAGDFDVLTLPFGGFGSAALHWDTTNAGFYDQGVSRGYNGIEPFDLLVGKGVLTADGTAPYLFDWAREVVTGKHDLRKALDLLNARFVLLHLDANIRYLTGADAWTGTAIRKVGGKLDQKPYLKLIYASNTLRLYSVTSWRPFRLFALRLPLIDGDVTTLMANIRPIRYRVTGNGRYVVNARQLHRDEVLVLNRPFDPQWHADGQAPVSVGPGLTAFEPPPSGVVTISYGLNQPVRFALLSLPVAFGACCLLLAFLGLRARSRRRTRLAS